MIRDLTAERAARIPSGARRVSDRHSDAVAYIYADSLGRPCAMGFSGRRSKPDFRFRYSSPERREAAIREFFANRQAQQARRVQRTANRKLQVGHILYGTWGYEQTNVDFYQVTALIGETMVELREIEGNTTQETGWMTGKAVPRADAFTGEPLRRKVTDGDTVRINSVIWARLWDGHPVNWTAYH